MNFDITIMFLMLLWYFCNAEIEKPLEMFGAMLENIEARKKHNVIKQILEKDYNLVKIQFMHMLYTAVMVMSPVAEISVLIHIEIYLIYLFLTITALN